MLSATAVIHPASLGGIGILSAEANGQPPAWALIRWDREMRMLAPRYFSCHASR
jgi:hypothetical protein